MAHQRRAGGENAEGPSDPETPTCFNSGSLHERTASNKLRGIVLNQSKAPFKFLLRTGTGGMKPDKSLERKPRTLTSFGEESRSVQFSLAPCYCPVPDIAATPKKAS